MKVFLFICLAMTVDTQHLQTD